MPNPKRRHSNTRTRKRRTHDKMSIVLTSGCANCGNHIPPHRVCPKCGFYKGRQVIQIKSKEKKKTA